MRLLYALLLGFLAATPLAAQTVRVVGAPGDSTALRVRAILARNNYRVLDRDTVLPETHRETGDLVVVEARVALEGTVTGSVVVIRGDFFTRPRSRVEGPIYEVGGDAFPSGLAEDAGVVSLDQQVAVAVAEATGGYVVTLTPQSGPGLIRIPRPFGIGLPTYDRVDGLTLRLSGGLGLGGDTANVSLTGTAAYHLERKEFGGGAELRLRPSPGTYVSLAARRATATPDEWIRGDFANSASSLFIRSDLRNYFETDEVILTVGRAPSPPLIEGERYLTPSVGIRYSEDGSLPAGDPWSVFNRKEAWRPNSPIDPGRIASAFAAAEVGWQGITASYAGSASVEWAPAGIEDFEFAQLTADGSWQMLAVWGHQINVDGHLLLPLQGDPPRQRWSGVGGPSTLPTFETAEFRGDHVLLVRSAYGIPVNTVTLPFVGPPTIRFEHAFGMAWETGESMPPLEQNIGAGVQLQLLTVMVYVNPAEEPLRGKVSIGLELPGF